MTDDPPRTVLVTGAGSGLGAATATAAAEAGWLVGVLDRDADAASRTAHAIGDAAVALTADTTDASAVEAALDTFAAASGAPTPDALVCNAGIVRFGPLLDLDADDWQAVVDVNLTGTFVTARAVARRMIAAGAEGSIVVITSMNGVAPGPNAGAYGATKAGVARLAQQMALEWGPQGIRVNAVAPGLIDAGISEAVYADPDIRSRRAERVPLRRLGTPSDVASVVLFLLSDAAGYVNGTELLVDGGVTVSVISTPAAPSRRRRGRHRRPGRLVSTNLVLSGGPGHDFDATTAALDELGDQHGFTTTVVTDPPDLFAALQGVEHGEIAPWDLVTVNALRWRMETGRYADQRDRLGFDLAAADAAILARHVESGGGLVVLHTGVICFDAEPTWHRLVGASWNWERSSHPPVAEVEVEVTAAGRDHPITVGLESFRVCDEVYSSLDTADDLVPLLGATHAGGEHPLLWTRTFGAGRVVTDLLGHGTPSFTQPDHRTIVGRALEWSCRA